eukprot:371615_1
MQLKHGRRHLCKHDAEPLCHVCGILLNIGSGKTLEIENYRWEKIKNPTCVMCHNMGGALFLRSISDDLGIIETNRKISCQRFRLSSTEYTEVRTKQYFEAPMEADLLAMALVSQHLQFIDLIL